VAEGVAIGMLLGCLDIGVEEVEMAVGYPEGRKLGLGIGIGVGPEIGIELGTERENPDGLVQNTAFGTH
jgi:hypothetical protein